MREKEKGRESESREREGKVTESSWEMSLLRCTERKMRKKDYNHTRLSQFT